MSFVKKDNKKIAEAYWREYEPFIRKICNSKLSSHQDYVDDCVQDVFTALIEALNNGTVITNPRSWFLRVTNNKICDIYSKAKKESIVSSYNDEVFDEDRLAYDNIEINLSAIDENKIKEVEDFIMSSLSKEEIDLLNDKYNRKISILKMARKRNTNKDVIYQRLSRLKKKIQTLINTYLESQSIQ